MPTGDGKAFRPLRFDGSGWAELMQLQPGAEVARHRHTGPVQALVLAGRTRLDTGEIADLGDYTYEAAGSVDAWAAVGPEPCVVHLQLQGTAEYLDETNDVISVVSSATQSARYREWCHSTGIPPVVESSPPDPATLAWACFEAWRAGDYDGLHRLLAGNVTFAARSEWPKAVTSASPASVAWHGSWTQSTFAQSPYGVARSSPGSSFAPR